MVVNPGFTINDGNGGKDYAVTLKSATGTITPAVLTIGAATNTRAYDGTNLAAVIPTVSGLLGGDVITGLTESYASKNVLGVNGSILQANPGYSINDGDSGKDYTITLMTTMGTITPAELTISAVTNTKVYDGTTTAAAIPIVSGLRSGDTASELAESYVSKNVLGTNGSTLQVNSGYSINDGDHGKDYTVTLKTATGTITPGAASKVVLSAAPATGNVGTALSSITVTIEDAFGNVVTGETSTVTLTIKTSPPSGGFSTGTITSVTVKNGSASFSGISFTTKGTYTLQATDGTLTSALTGNIVIS